MRLGVVTAAVVVDEPVPMARVVRGDQVKAALPAKALASKATVATRELIFMANVNPVSMSKTVVILFK